MKKLMLATAIAATAFSGAAYAESTVVQQRAKLDQIFAKQKGETEVKQVTRNDEGGFFARTFGGFNFQAVSPEKAELGSKSDFRAGDRGR